MLSFNLKALLIPPTIIPSTVEEFEYEFAIKTGDSKRIELFDKYKSYCSDLKILTGKASLQQWIDVLTLL